jgi:raffinose/stachyose/melibiose transport system permease protein
VKNNRNKSLFKQKEKSTCIAATIFLTPVILIMLVYIIYPILSTFSTSLYDWNGISTSKVFIGFNNWKKLVADISFWTAFKNNITIMVCSILIQIPIGLALATFMDAGGRKLNIFKVLWFLPFLMSSVAIGFLFSYALATTGGIVTTISQAFDGGKIDLLGRAPQALYAVIGVIAWQFIPYYMVYFMAGYSSIDNDVYEAAIIDGATRGKYFRHVALPLLLPVVRTACILSLIGSLKYFDLIYVMTGGGPGTATELMATYMYKLSFQHFKMGYGSTAAAGMFILITVIALLFQKLIKGKEDA